MYFFYCQHGITIVTSGYWVLWICDPSFPRVTVLDISLGSGRYFMVTEDTNDRPNEIPSDATVPKVVVSRISLYLRELQRLQSAGKKTISSSQLGTLLGFSDAQVRKDLGFCVDSRPQNVRSLNTFCKTFRQVNGGVCPILRYIMCTCRQI